MIAVVPFAGTWIETENAVSNDRLYKVVPFAGTWIETGRVVAAEVVNRSFPSRERGLKLSLPDCTPQRRSCRSLRGNVD